MNKEETFKQFKEIMSKKCKTCKKTHPELNKRCDYIYCNKEDWYKK